MRTVFITATAICALVAAAPAFAQDTVTGAPPGEAPVTTEGYGNGPGQPGQPGIGTDYPYWASPNRTDSYGPGYGYYGWWGPFPFGPVGGAAAGVGAFGSDVVGAAGTVASGAANTVTYPVRHHCHVYRDAAGRRICGP